MGTKGKKGEWGKGWGHNGDPEKAKVRAHEWRARNPEKLKLVQWANAVNMRGSIGRSSYADMAAIREDQHGKCKYCKVDLGEFGGETDHILPLKRGGTNWPWNIQFLCAKCNDRKAMRDPVEFEYSEGFYGEPWFQLFEQRT